MEWVRFGCDAQSQRARYNFLEPLSNWIQFNWERSTAAAAAVHCGHGINTGHIAFERVEHSQRRTCRGVQHATLCHADAMPTTKR